MCIKYGGIEDWYAPHKYALPLDLHLHGKFSSIGNWEVGQILSEVKNTSEVLFKQMKNK